MAPRIDYSPQVPAEDLPGSPRRRQSLAPLLQAPLWLLYPVYITFVLALRSLPERTALCIGKTFYARVACLARAKRLRNFRNVLTPFGWSDVALQKLNRDYLDFQARLAVDLARMSALDSVAWKNHVALNGESELRSALEDGRGALVIGCHLGNWFYISTTLAVMGFPVSNVAARIPFPPLERDLQRLRRRVGLRCTTLGEGGAATAADSFARGGIFCTLIDLSLRRAQGQWLPFGPSRLSVDLGPARLALRHDVPVLFSYCHRASNGRWVVTLLPLGRPSALPVHEQTPEALTARWLAMLHETVLKHPEQWWPWSFTTLAK
jgi:KDO2-lipid IV(A) lauroyltransferase